MSNIDKQALREIAAAAVGAHERLSVMPPDDIFDISLAEGTQLDADITALNALNSAANPATVLALLDELEAKDKSISFLKDQLAQLANFNPDWDKLEAATDSLREHMAELTAARKRIAELEARELVVNLPAYVDGRTLGYGEVNHMIDLCADAIEKAGHSAGIITKVGGG